MDLLKSTLSVANLFRFYQEGIGINTVSADMAGVTQKRRVKTRREFEQEDGFLLRPVHALRPGR